MILGYKKGLPGQDSYWFGKIGGADKKFIRCVCGVALPVLDRINGAMVVVVELYRSFAPADLTAIAAMVGPWNLIENALIEYRRNLKFSDIICEDETYRDILNRTNGWLYGLGEIPCITAAAPAEAFTEIGRSKVDALVSEKRLNLDLVGSMLGLEADMGARALQAAVLWMLAFPAYYQPTRRRETPKRRVFGTTGL